MRSRTSCLVGSRRWWLLGNFFKMGLIAAAAESIIRGLATFPELNIAWIWYETTITTSFEVLVVPADLARCTLATIQGHFSR